ncbi:MAG: RHS repeat-associated core domain-containing protein [Verrucomicrobia bacterium]|nr:RHS repeat-associated core domain-containing protein [Verrucomicrobiota bacterium]
MRFSSKPWIQSISSSSGLYAYGYRFYDPTSQRWMNRDPIGEWDGLNIYVFVGNEPFSQWDSYGLLAGGRGAGMGSPGGITGRVGGGGRGMDGCPTREEVCEKSGGKWSSLASREYGGSVSKCIAGQLGTLTGILASVAGTSGGGGAVSSAVSTALVRRGIGVGAAAVLGFSSTLGGAAAGFAPVLIAAAESCVREECVKEAKKSTI